MLTSDFRPEVEIHPFHACAMKNMHNPYLTDYGGQWTPSQKLSTVHVC